MTTETTHIKNLTKAYPQHIKKLEQYVYYMLRCLHRINIHPTPSDITLVTLPRPNGTIAEAVIYPPCSVDINHEIINPLFCYGFKTDWDFTNLQYPIKVTFTENIKELMK